MSSTSSSSSTRASNGGSGTQACAACKYQRRKCTPDCILAPYFPPEKQREFHNAHRLFGVSNILKIIRNLDPHQRAQAMTSIIFQADARARDPVGGCYAVVAELWRQINRETAELDAVLRYLAVYRDQYARAAQAQGLPPPPPLPPLLSTHPTFLAEPVIHERRLIHGTIAPHSSSPAPPAAAAAPGTATTLLSNHYNNNTTHHHHLHHQNMMQQRHEQEQVQLPNNIAACYYPTQLQQQQQQQLFQQNNNNDTNNNSFDHHLISDDLVADIMNQTTHHHYQLMPKNNDNNEDDDSSSFMDNNSRTATNFDNEYDDDVKPHLLGMLDANPAPLLGNIPNDSFPCSSSSNRSPIGESSGNLEDVQEHDLKVYRPNMGSVGRLAL